MNHPAISVFIVVTSAVLASLPVFSAETASGSRAVPARDNVRGADTSVLRASPSAPPAGTLHLPPGMQRGVASAGASRLNSNQLQHDVDAFQNIKAIYDQVADQVSKASAYCSGKAYTKGEQSAAGCSGNETMNQCMEKLYSKCMLGQHVTVPLFVDDSAGSALQKWSQKAAASARALSQTLDHYANAVEQNAKANLP